ncbi:hypothetical protein, partial [Alistipes ihumii]|uniref:hypothetical protein n=1 Tax=Alistipes ihumii TaxID=1470347 RepID=UPI003AB21BF6
LSVFQDNDRHKPSKSADAVYLLFHTPKSRPVVQKHNPGFHSQEISITLLIFQNVVMELHSINCKVTTF